MTRIGQDLEKLFVGFNDTTSFTNFTPPDAHPRFNIFKTNEGAQIEVAVPGLDRSDLEIRRHKDTLTIKGNRAACLWPDSVTMHRGISGKAFTRTFKVDTDLVIKKASLLNGILTINLEHSEATKPVCIDIA